MESQHSVEGPVGREFPRFVIISEILLPEAASRLPFFEKIPLPGRFKKNFVPTGFIATQIHVLCANSKSQQGV